jgi:hypothetical protein
MGTAKVRIVRDSQALAVLLSSPSGGVAKDMYRRGVNVQNRAKRNLERQPRRIDTGNLRSDIHVQLLSLGGKPAIRVGFNLFYGVFVHDGTGIYGPKGTPITPRVSTYLRWKPKGGGWMYAKSVKGMRPNPFLADAVVAAKD